MTIFLSIILMSISFLGYLLTINKVYMYFKIFLLSSLGLGSHYNLLFRMGDIMIADITLLLFTVSFFLWDIKERNFRYNKKEWLVITIFACMLMLGIVSNNSMGNILRDVKIFIYFFIPLFYIRRIKENKEIVHNLFKFILKISILTIILNIINFFSTGMVDGVDSILRTFGIGLGYPFIALVSIILISMKDEIVRLKGYKFYCIIQCILVFCIIISYTRSVWLQFIISYLLIIIYKLYNEKGIIRIRSILIILPMIFIVGITLYNLKSSENKLYTIVEEKFKKIKIFSIDENDTLAYRLDDIASTKDKFKDIRIITGFGFGDTRKIFNPEVNEGNLGEGTGTENSFLYYIWKYGIFNFLLLIWMVISKMKVQYDSKNKFNQTLMIGLTIYMLNLSLSGDLNKYYGLPIIAILLIIDFSKIININN